MDGRGRRHLGRRGRTASSLTRGSRLRSGRGGQVPQAAPGHLAGGTRRELRHQVELARPLGPGQARRVSLVQRVRPQRPRRDDVGDRALGRAPGTPPRPGCRASRPPRRSRGKAAGSSGRGRPGPAGGGGPRSRPRAPADPRAAGCPWGCRWSRWCTGRRPRDVAGPGQVRCRLLVRGKKQGEPGREAVRAAAPTAARGPATASTRAVSAAGSSGTATRPAASRPARAAA